MQLDVAAGWSAVPPVSPEPPRTYRLEATRRGLLSLLAVALAVLAFTLSYWFTTQPVGESVRLIDSLVLLAVPLLLLTAAVAMQRATRRIRIVCAEDGLTYHGFASTLSVTWPDVTGTRVDGRGIFRGTGLVLGGQARVEAPRLLKRLGLSASDRFLPLAPFAEPLRGSTLEHDIRHHAPRAFGPDERQPTVHL
jgi:hypothetical protein